MSARSNKVVRIFVCGRKLWMPKATTANSKFGRDLKGHSKSATPFRTFKRVESTPVKAPGLTNSKFDSYRTI